MKKKRVKKETKKGFNPKVHYSIKNRKIFKAKMWLRFLLLLVLLAGCAVMVMFGGWKWNPDEGFSPITNPTEPWHYALIWCGAILALLFMVGYVLWHLKTWKGFYDTQAAYFKTKEFEKAKKEALNVDISKLTKSTIKWYKKIGYINGAKKTEMLEKLKSFKKQNKAKK